MLLASDGLNAPAPLVRHVRVGERGYDAIVEWGGLGRLAYYLTQLGLPSRIFLVTDSNLEGLYGPAMLQQLSEAGFEPLGEIWRGLDGRKVSEEEQCPTDLGILLRTALTLRDVPLHANQLDTGQGIVHEG